ncbi:uncharacterized protein N0V89_000146 [Didymosphaeria variabile]|uniref:Uncharacterized protein n=1 Tax=Didymosphaeria variabile TaxID=1932322 RepID=A0A9W8XUR7_9PLEO|nr:uncharacterized protein N0V89_000146 [Didymosphaeria variabile]KAJ4359591.1 hypothetical protein N0V89_000146 [Didymosphaeria variabile]
MQEDPELQITRLQTGDEIYERREPCTTYHIYPVKDKCHKRITAAVDIKRESPLSREGRTARKERKARRANEQHDAGTDEAYKIEKDQDDKEQDAFYLHSPYLSFASPPQVLYIGSTNHTPFTPAVLIHPSFLWKRYKLQYGESLAKTGVLDPRGVVSWTHNGGSKSDLKRVPTTLKGYKVRTWRLWGECGKNYVHEVNSKRKCRTEDWPDPDVLEIGPGATEKPVRPVQAEGVLYLEWDKPFSKRTREYRWRYGGLEFRWKGTGRTEKTGFWGWFVKINHLKLVAMIPEKGMEEDAQTEVCLARYTCSVSKKKNGRLEIHDERLLRLYEEHVRDQKRVYPIESEETRVKALKITMFYALVIATAVCMVSSEKAKREAVGKWIKEAAENAGG